MKKEEAISAAFGRTRAIRRTSWCSDSSGHAVITIGRSPVENEKFRTDADIYVGDSGKNVPDRSDADDWEIYPAGNEPAFNWRRILSSSDDHTARGAKCEITLDGKQLEANCCILAWVVPNELSFLIRCDDERFDGWPQNEDGIHHNLHVVAEGLVQEFATTRISIAWKDKDLCEYRFTVGTPE